MIKRAIFSLIESFLRNISGGIGSKLRFIYYRRRFKKCGLNLRIDIGVIFENPENMVIGSNVWVMEYSHLIAKPRNFEVTDRYIKKIMNDSYTSQNEGALEIGSEVQVGPYNIIHGFGGLLIKNRVTLSARVSIYSFSHYYRNDNDPSQITYANGMVTSASVSCVESPIVLQDGVWLGLGVSVFSGTIKKNSFVVSGSIVTTDIPENSYAQGHPAARIKERFLDYHY
jgi:acetyltransferase-like isoleucine patch superfamily enzyme